jgi:hypothetical protein
MASLTGEAQVNLKLRDSFVAQVTKPLRGQVKGAFIRAIDRGEIAPECDVDAALDVIFGAMYHRVFQGQEPLDERFIKAVAGIVVRGLSSKSDATGASRGRNE